jgi:hypothetical protein
MFEIGIVCVIILAVAYWTVLWLMGRREDVLHGEFVEGKAEPDEPVRADVAEPQARPVFLERPAFPARPSSPERPAFPERPVFPKRPTLPERPVQTAAPEQPAFRRERLESLLNSIKQDLNQLVRK